MKSLKTIVFIIPLLFSCSPSPDVTKAKISLGATVATSDFPGGLYILGHNIDTEIVFMKRVQSNDYEIELENGKWEVGAIGWDQSANNLQGIPKCFMTSPLELDGGDKEITLEPSLSGCGVSPFKKESENYNFANGSPKPLKFISCAGLSDRNLSKDNIENAYDCSDYPGKFRSYKVTLFDINFSHNERMGQEKTNPFDSVCIQDGGADQLIDAGANASPIIFDGIPQGVKAYETANCTGAHKQIDFNSGLHSADISVNKSFIRSNSTSNHIYFDQEFCTQEAIDSTTADSGDGTVNSPYIICNKTELENMSGTAYYQLGKEIDAAGFTTNPGNFQGSLNGNKNSIKNLDKPLFYNIYPTSTGSTINNLTIKNGNINYSDSYIGFISRTISIDSSNKANIENLSFDNVTINNSNPSTSGVGLITGSVNVSISAQFKLSNIDVFHSGGGMNNITSASTASNGTGGLIGKIDNSTGSAYNAELKDIEVNNLNITGESGKIGGVIGHAQSIELANTQVRASQISGKGTSIGGIIGYITESSLNMTAFASDTTLGQPINEVTCSKGIGLGSVGCYDIGGIAGTVVDNTVIENTHSVFKLHDPDDTVSIVGGIAGLIGDGANPNLIKNSSAHVDFKINGSYIGGIAGRVNDASLFNGTYGPVSNILSSASYGSISTQTQVSSNHYRGGITGFLYNNAKIKHSGAFLILLQGDTYLGGAVGLNQGTIEEVLVKIGSIISKDAGGSNEHKTGGIVGDNLTTGKVKYSFVTDTNIKADDGDCKAAYQCGLIIGTNTNSTTTSSDRAAHFNSFGNSTIDGNVHNGSVFKTIGGPSSNTGAGTSPGNNFSVLNTASAAHSLYIDSFYDNTQFNNISSNDVPFLENSADFGMAVPVFVQKWHELGFKDYGDGPRYVAGNIFDPLLIENHNDWNKIQNNDFLLTKAFALNGDINFSGQQFIPIGFYEDGGNIHCPPTEKTFTGSILVSRHEDKDNHSHFIRNVSLDTGSNWDPGNCTGHSLGLITKAGHESQALQSIFGTPDNSIKIENIDIQNPANNYFIGIGGVIGNSVSSLISTHAKDIKLSNLGAASNSAGGLVGRAEALLVAASDVSVEIDAGGIFSAGGIVGSQSSAPIIAIQNKVQIKKLIGAHDVGGLAGSINGTHVELRSNIIEFADTPLVIDTVGAGTFGGFAAQIGDLSNSSDNLVILKSTNRGTNATTKQSFTGSSPEGLNNISIGGPDDNSGADLYFNTIQDYLNSGNGLKNIYYDSYDSKFKQDWEKWSN